MVLTKRVQPLRESIQRLFNEGMTIMTTRCDPVAAGPSQSNPKGSGPKVLKRERGHVTFENWRFGGGGLQGQCVIE